MKRTVRGKYERTVRGVRGEKDGSHLAVCERREAVDGVRESRLVRRDDGALNQVLLGVIPYLERW